MSLFEKEIARVQNPAYGAILVYYLAKGYAEAQAVSAPIPLPYLFVGLPLLLTPEVSDLIKHTTSGMRAVADKINSGANTGTDLLTGDGTITTKDCTTKDNAFTFDPSEKHVPKNVPDPFGPGFHPGMGRGAAMGGVVIPAPPP